MVEKVEGNHGEGRDSQGRILEEKLKLILRYYEPLSLVHVFKEQQIEVAEIRLNFHEGDENELWKSPGKTV